MATILQFQCTKSEDEEAVSVSSEETHTAEIIIFPGVRVERYECDPFDEPNDLAVKQAKQD